MGDYTIKSGDNLWNICKRQFKLNNNAEIAKKVNEVAKANGISNPNLIFAGKTLELGDAMDKVEKSNPTETVTQTPVTSTSSNPIEKKDQTAPISPEQVAVAKDFDNWATNKENYEKTWKAYTSGNEPETPPVADFDFLGVDMTKVSADKKAETYTNGLLKFSQANILNANTDSDTTTLTFEEFFAKEKKDAEASGAKIPTEEAARQAFNNIDIDGNGKVDDKELSSTFAFMDTSKGSGNDSGKMDGKIDHNSIVFTNFADSRIGNKLKEYHNFLFPKSTEENK